MGSAIIHCATLIKSMPVGPALEDITGDLNAALQESGVNDGVTPCHSSRLDHVAHDDRV